MGVPFRNKQEKPWSRLNNAMGTGHHTKPRIVQRCFGELSRSPIVRPIAYLRHTRLPGITLAQQGPDASLYLTENSPIEVPWLSYFELQAVCKCLHINAASSEDNAFFAVDSAVDNIITFQVHRKVFLQFVILLFREDQFKKGRLAGVPKVAQVRPTTLPATDHTSVIA